jgi:hypothetical protein
MICKKYNETVHGMSHALEKDISPSSRPFLQSFPLDGGVEEVLDGGSPLLASPPTLGDMSFQRSTCGIHQTRLPHGLALPLRPFNFSRAWCTIEIKLKCCDVSIMLSIPSSSMSLVLYPEALDTMAMT